MLDPVIILYEIVAIGVIVSFSLRGFFFLKFLLICKVAIHTYERNPLEIVLLLGKMCR